MDLHSLDGGASSATGSDSSRGIRLDVKEALEQEVKMFEYREKLLFHFRVSKSAKLNNHD